MNFLAEQFHGALYQLEADIGDPLVSRALAESS
jgi:hypothetical protein